MHRIIPMPESQTDPITVSIIREYRDEFRLGGGWNALAGRLVVQWRDSIESSDFFLIGGTDDPAQAIKAELAEFSTYEVDSTDWSNTLSCYRVRTPAEIIDGGWADSLDEVHAIYGSTRTNDLDDWLDELACAQLILQPSVPPCYGKSGFKLHDSHKWIHGQAYGSGGGVRYADTCKRCGIERHTDTWATDPCDGSQGHVSTAYYEADGITRILRPGVIEQD